MTDTLDIQIAAVIEDTGVEELGLAVQDFATGRSWQYNSERWFHAASTIKVAILVALAAAVDEGRFQLESRLAVRNRFLSALDGEPYRILAARDSNAVVHRHIGRTMKIGELARHMIVTSSNLATNLLLDLIGVDSARQTLSRLGFDQGVDLCRGVEDERAFSAGINNRVTADGLVQMFTAIHEGRAASPASTQRILDILLQQEFGGGIPAGLPEQVRAQSRVAHKTGEISNMAHDAGLVFLPDGSVYALAVLTGMRPDTPPPDKIIARISRAVYDWVSEARSVAAPEYAHD